MATALSGALGVVLLLSATLKGLGWDAVLTMIRGLHLPSIAREQVLAAFLIATELGIGASLLGGLIPHVALPVTAVFFLGALAALFRLRRIGYEGGCACFGRVGHTRIHIIDILRTMGLAGCATGLSVYSLINSCYTKPIWTLGRMELVVSLSGFLMIVVTGYAARAIERIAEQLEKRRLSPEAGDYYL